MTTSSGRRSFFDLKDGNKSIVDRSVTKRWETIFGPDDKELWSGIKFPVDYPSQKREEIASLTTEKNDLEEVVKAQEEALKAEPELIDESILTVEERVYLRERWDNIKIISDETKHILGEIKINELINKLPKNSVGEVINCDLRKIF